jgi:hypothetical protein
MYPPIIWVGPDQIAHGSFVRHFLYSIQVTGVIESINARRQASVQTKDAIRDDRSHGKIVKGIGEVFPNVGVPIFTEAFIIESIPVDVKISLYSRE